MAKKLATGNYEYVHARSHALALLLSDSYVIYPHRSVSLTGSGYLIEPTAEPNARGTYGMVEMVEPTSIKKEDSTKIKRPITETVPDMNAKDVKILRAKTQACTDWSEDEEREKIEGMSNDEAAAIMLYTQGKRKGVHSVQTHCANILIHINDSVSLKISRSHIYTYLYAHFPQRRACFET